MTKKKPNGRQAVFQQSVKGPTPKGIDKIHAELRTITPLTERQRSVFESDKNQVLHGWAGTGKTFIASYLAYQALHEKKYKKLIYLRSAVSTRSIGFLPGTESEKMRVYEAPYQGIATELYNSGTVYEEMKAHKVVEFMPTSFIRGITITDSIIIADECQNMTYHELDTIITRLGKGNKIYFCGDFRQSDLAQNGIKDFFDVLGDMPEDFNFVDFKLEDIVRGGLTKRYLIAKNNRDKGNNNESSIK